jgi:hypothetical protein
MGRVAECGNHCHIRQLCRVATFAGLNQGPADRISAVKIFLTRPSPEQIFLSTLDTAYQITLGSPVPGPIFSMRVLGCLRL